MKTYLFGFVFLLILSSIVFIKDDYEKEIMEWRKGRVEELKNENGWLNLAGLFWLKEGENSFGSDISNDIIFPNGKAKPFMGKFVLANGVVTFSSLLKKQILINNIGSQEAQLFPSEENKVSSFGSLRWFVIKRGQKYGVRLRDLESEFLQEFKGVSYFDIDPSWRVKAKYEKTVGQTIGILDVTGQTNQLESPGKVTFSRKGKLYSMHAIAEGEQLFFVFGDKTNKISTYGAGRFLYAPMPKESGEIFLDFNKAQNPPCAFTPFATCPLPPEQNMLDLEVTAGEKNYHLD
jgi:uncharacterized protein